MSLLLTPPNSGEKPIPFDELVAKVKAELPETLPRDLNEILIALDVDGTILLPEGASERVLDAFHTLNESGATVVIATGRGTEGVRPVWRHLQADSGWSVCSNGAVAAHWNPTFDDGVEIIRTHTFNPAPVIDRLCEAMPDVYLGVEVLKGFLISRTFPGPVFFEDTWMRDVAELRETDTPRLVAMAEGMEIMEFEATIREMGIGDIAQYAVGWTTWVDIGPKGCTKATGLQDLVDELGIAPHATIAVGDGMNDIEMLTWAAHGVAMGSALPEVRRAANAVTGSVENDGAAAVMCALVERSKERA